MRHVSENTTPHSHTVTGASVTEQADSVLKCHNTGDSDGLELTNEIAVKLKTKLHGLSPRANYTDRATAACR
jgi:predicted esterase